jgi:chorismate dehydratase
MSPRVLRIGVVDFLNAWPLWAALEDRADITLDRDVPSALVKKLHAGEVDAALISSVEYFKLPDGYTYHPNLCIGAEQEVCSIRLFVPEKAAGFSATLSNTSVIYTDIASRSSVAQLRVMLRELKADIPLVEIDGAEEKIPQLKAGEALLSIGDTALRHRECPSFDLQAEYFALFSGFIRRGFRMN